MISRLHQPHNREDALMIVSIKQVWVFAVAIVAAGFALDALDGSPVEERLDYAMTVATVCFGITVMGFANKRRN